MEGTIIFITGGARSGKSSFAEQFAMRFSGRLRYVATARRTDMEMIERIERHEKLRLTYNHRWETIECPLLKNLKETTFSPEDIVLFDCLTVFMANELYHARNEEITLTVEKQLQSKIKGMFLKIAKHVKALIIVSNELFYEGHAVNDIVHQYRRALGRLHEEIVKDAHIALLIEAGEPIVMKGEELFKQRLIR